MMQRAAAVLTLCVVGLPALGAAQEAPPDYLANGIARVNSGDFQMGIMTLNEVTGSNAEPGVVAQAHAYRAQAYLGLKQPERARAAALAALKADAAIIVSAPPYSPETAKLFDSLRAPATSNPEEAAAAAERAGDDQSAFLSYLTAYQALPDPAPAADDRRLRERIIDAVGRLPAPPAIPPDARAHFDKATELLEAEAVLGGSGTAGTQAAATELQRAIRIAPWWAEATFKLAGLQQKLQQVDAALLNLALYKRADPEGYAAATAPKATAPPAAARPAPPAPATPPAPALATGTVVIYRIPHFVAGGARADVDCNGRRMAELQNGRVVRFTAAAGRQLIRVHDKDVEIDVVPGTEIYLETEAGFASYKAEIVSAAQAQSEIKKRNLKPNDAKRVTSTVCQ